MKICDNKCKIIIAHFNDIFDIIFQTTNQYNAENMFADVLKECETIKSLCMNCEYCLDYAYFLKILKKYFNREININQLKTLFYMWNLSKALDDGLDNLPINIAKQDFNYEDKFIRNENPKIYGSSPI